MNNLALFGVLMLTLAVLLGFLLMPIQAIVCLHTGLVCLAIVGFDESLKD